MGRKNAMTGLWWGGGKGVIVQDPDSDFQDPTYRKTLFTEYGDFLTSLRYDFFSVCFCVLDFCLNYESEVATLRQKIPVRLFQIVFCS